MNIYALYRRIYRDLPELPDVSTIDVETWEPDDPEAFFGPIDRRNLFHRIQPESLRGRILRLHKRREYEKRRALMWAEDDRRAALRGPPTNCRREGNVLTWDPPDIPGGQRPDCYWIEAEYRGEWTTLQPPIYPDQPRDRALYRGTGRARVAAYYENEPLRNGWGFRRGPTLDP